MFESILVLFYYQMGGGGVKHFRILCVEILQLEAV